MIKSVQSKERNLEIHYFQALYVEAAIPQEPTLSFGYYSTLRTRRMEGKPEHSLLLLLDEENWTPELWSRYGNVAITQDHELFNRCVEQLDRIFQKEYHLAQGHIRLLKMITAGRSLPDLLNEISLLYGHYFDVLDNSLNLDSTAIKT